MKKAGAALFLSLMLSLMATVASGTEGLTVLIPQGEYVVGESLPAGVYTVVLPAGTKIIVEELPAEVLSFKEPEAISGFDKLSSEFDQMLLEAKGYKEIIDLCDEYDNLLATLTSDSHGLDSSAEFDMKIRYYKVKDLLREVPGGIIQAKDGDIAGFQEQVATLRKVMGVLLEEVQASMLKNLSGQSNYYAQALEDEKEAREKLKETLDRRNELLQLILNMADDKNRANP